MRFYIGPTFNEVQVEVQPHLIKALDTTNDNFNCLLKANTIQTPYKPMTPFKVVYDDNTIQIFWIINDSVSVFSLNPETYKHSLTLVQYRYFLNKHILRNTIFSQPKDSQRKMYTAISEGLTALSQYKMGVNDLDYIWYEGMSIKKPAKLSTFAFKIEIYGIYATDINTYEMKECFYDDIVSLNNVWFNSDSKIKIIDTNNNNYVIATISIYNYIKQIGEKVYLGTIKESINEYLKNHSSVSLKALYDAETTDLYNSCFLRETTTPDYPMMTSFFIHFNFFTELYNYTMYDVIDTLLQQYRLTSDNFDSKREQLFYLPTENSTGEDLELYNLLTSTYPPDTLAFTQATWYDVLTDIFRFYDAGFKFDENKILKIEYYNNINKEFDKSLIGISLTQADKNYCKNRIAEYQNAIEEVETKRLPTRSTGLGVPQRTEFAIILPKPIYLLEEIYIDIPDKIKFQSSGWLPTYSVYMPLLDLTPFFINQDSWSTLPSGYSGGLWQELYQNNTIPYQRGSTSISVSTYYKEYWGIEEEVLKWVLLCAIHRFMGITNAGQESGSISLSNDGKTTLEDLAEQYYKQMFNIKFLTELNGRVQIETITNQYNGEMLTNQGNSQIDLNKFGLSIFVESLKNGEPTLSANCEITKWEDRVVEGDYFIDNDGFRWIATVVNYTLLPNGNTKCSIEFSKNFNLAALRIISNRQKRLTQISRELGTKSEDNYVDYIYASDISPTIENETIVLDSKVLESIIGQTFKLSSSNYYVQNIDLVCIVQAEVAGNKAGTYIPLMKYGAGNSICFEIQYDDPICAGYRLECEIQNDIANYNSVAVLYADADGFKEKMTIDFCDTKSSDLKTAITNSAFPTIIEKVIGINVVKVGGTLQNLNYIKKHNEIFGLNYQWCFLPLPNQINNFFIGNKFINENFATTPEKIKGKSYYLRYTTSGNFQYSIMDTKGEGEEWWRPLRFRISYSGNVVTLEILRQADVEDPQTQYAKTWSIVDENGDIYFASNTPATFDSTGMVKIYFVTKRQRI